MNGKASNDGDSRIHTLSAVCSKSANTDIMASPPGCATSLQS
jgi:hypothetical protein